MPDAGALLKAGFTEITFTLSAWHSACPDGIGPVAVIDAGRLENREKPQDPDEELK
jgi:hypothetical protein